MRTRSLYAIGLAAFAAPLLPSCDSITTGQLSDDPGPLKLARIMIQDERPRGGRNLATDLLDKLPDIKCSDTKPCPAGNQSNPPCAIPMGMTEGVCPDPLKAAQTPPALGTPIAYGGNAIRLVFNKAIDGSQVEDVMPKMTDPNAFTYAIKMGILELDGPDGKPVSSVYYYDPQGSASVTSDIFVEPFGPALVIKPKAPLAPSAMYTIKILDPSKIKDHAGHALTADVNGMPIAAGASYAFTTEALYPITFSADASKDVIAPNDVLTLATNANVDPETITTKNVTVTMGGMPVMVEAFADPGGDPKKCAMNENDEQIDIVRVTAPGMPTDWAPGDYLLTVAVSSADNAKAGLMTDAFGTTPYAMIKFTVKGMKGDPKTDSNAVDNFLLPEQCVVPMPDGGMGGGGDMSMGASDGGLPDGLGIGG